MYVLSAAEVLMSCVRAAALFDLQLCSASNKRSVRSANTIGLRHVSEVLIVNMLEFILAAEDRESPLGLNNAASCCSVTFGRTSCHSVILFELLCGASKEADRPCARQLITKSRGTRCLPRRPCAAQPQLLRARMLSHGRARSPSASMA